MQVILGSDAIHRPLTGIGRYALELARHLREMPEVERLDFFAFGRWPLWDELLAADGALEPLSGPVSGPSQGGVSLRSRLAGQAWAVRAYQALTPHWYAWRLRHRGDALFHSPNYFLPPHAGPMVATIHDLSHVWFPQFHPQARVDFLNRALPDTFRRADFLITDAESVRQEVIERFGWPEDKIAAVPLGVDPVFHPRSAVQVGDSLGRLGLAFGSYALFVGTIEPRKNLATLLDAYENLPHALRQRWPLVVVGSRGWNSEALHARMAVAATQGWLRYLSFVPQQDLPLLYAGAHLFVFPSLYEGFGLPPLEAMASGVPVVCSQVSSLPGVVGDAALLFDPHDVQALGLALRQGLEDASWRAGARSAGLARAQAFTWRATAEATLQCYERCWGSWGGG